MTVRVLVVDDEPDIRLMLRMQLEQEGGFTVTAVGDGLQALDLIGTADVVILDIRMPGIDGYEVMRRLAHKPHPPVIALSAHARSEGAGAALSAGCVDYLTKPYMLDDLTQAIATAVATSKPGQ